MLQVSGKILNSDAVLCLIGLRIATALPDLPRFSQPAITGVSRFRFVGEYISPS